MSQCPAPSNLNKGTDRTDALINLYLDCDGVLADFEGGAYEILGMDYRDYQRQYGREKYIRRLASSPHFYEKLNILPGAEDFFAKVAIIRPTILTSLIEPGWAKQQKLRWINRYFPGTRVIATLENKSIYCKIGDVLVDDNPIIADSWRSAGGIAIVHSTFPATLAALQAIFSNIKAG